MGAKRKMTKHFLVDPKAEIVNTKLPLFTDNLLGDDSRKDITNALEKEMTKYGGIGLSANQIGLPFRMFVMGGHPQIEEGKVRYVFNPLINDVSKETISLKEGCLSFPFLFLLINRPKWVSVRYTNENSEEVEETLHGMAARIFQHENEHMNGYIFTDLVSKFKLDRAKKAQKKLVKETIRRRNA